MSKKLYEEITAGSMADSSTKADINSSASIAANPLLYVVFLCCGASKPQIIKEYAKSNKF